MISNRFKFPEASPEDIAKQMRINADILMKEITDHIDVELKRFARTIDSIKNEGHFS